MNKIVIDLHYCSREEHEELKEYLDDKSWNYLEIPDSFDNASEIKSTLDDIIALAEGVLESMPQKGDKSEDCQRVALQLALNNFGQNVNGIEENDLT